MQENNTTPEGSNKNICKPQLFTIYTQAIRAIRKAAELVGKIDGCDEAKGQLERFADQLLQVLEEVKKEVKAAMKAAKTGDKLAAADETKPAEPLD